MALSAEYRGVMRVGVAGVLLALLASACGGSSESGPRVLPSVSVSPSASASASAVPTGINAPTAQGAADFVRFFYAEITRAFAERDPSIVSALSLPSCKTCKLYIDSIASIRAKNQRVEGGGFRITFAVAPGDAGATATVDVGFDFGAARIVDAGGRVVRSDPAQPRQEDQVALHRVGDVWRVATIKSVQQP